MQNLTPRQMTILRFVRAYRRKEGYSPSLQEIGDHMDLTKVTVFEHVAALVKKGFLRRGPRHKGRSLQIAPDFRFPEETGGRVPLAGRIAAGRPIEAIQNREELDLVELFQGPGEVFALRVQGSSMIDEQIRDGDYVVCRRNPAPRNGQTVVALLDSGEATLKKFYKESGRVRLQPANPDFQPIYAKDVNVQGVVIGVVRKV
jgi:repressor LexA